MLRVMGAVLLMAGCGGFGFALAAHHARQRRLLEQLLRIINEMEWELKFRLTALPDLCRMAGEMAKGELGSLFQTLGNRLDREDCGQVSGCMNALCGRPELPAVVRRCLRELGDCLGRFDLEGQLQGLQQTRQRVRQELSILKEGGKERVRSYETLALCAGAALAILLI